MRRLGATAWLDGQVPLAVEEVGAKAAGIQVMRSLGLTTPEAFVIPLTAAWHGRPSGPTSDLLWRDIVRSVEMLAERVGRALGDPTAPLVLAVRSGAVTSMPGILDTVLDVGSAARTPAQALAQLRSAIGAVRASWDSSSARRYRAVRGIAEARGTAVIVQVMVDGTRDERSGTGVAFSGDLASGALDPTGEWLPSARGDQLVSGRATPEPLAALARSLPEVIDELARALRVLTVAFRDVVEVEYTVESGILHLLQVRVAKRGPAEAIRLARALCEAGIVDAATAVERISAEHVTALVRPGLRIDSGRILAEGLPVGGGAVAGVVTTSSQLAGVPDGGASAVLALPSTSPRDVPAMMRAGGVVTDTGGSTSHAALICRELGIPAVVGCGPGTAERLDGRLVTVDGSSGLVVEGAHVSTVEDGRLHIDVDWLLRQAEAIHGGPLPPEHRLAPLCSSARGEPGPNLI